MLWNTHTRTHTRAHTHTHTHTRTHTRARTHTWAAGEILLEKDKNDSWYSWSPAQSRAGWASDGVSGRYR